MVTDNMDLQKLHGEGWTNIVVLWGPVLRLEKDQKKTGPRLEKTGPAVRFFENLKQKTAKRPVYMDQFRLV